MKYLKPTILVFLTLSLLISKAQNIFDIENSIKYADFLYKNKEFELAAQEYERLLYFEKNNTEFQYRLINSYRLNSNFDKALNTLSFHNLDKANLSSEISNELVKVYIDKPDYLGGINFIEGNNKILNEQKNKYYIIISLLQGNSDVDNYFPSDANQYDNELKQLKSLVKKDQANKYKKPGTSVLLSVFVPGAGKIYSGYWKDGLFSLLFFSISSLQAYRGFEKKGKESVYGWIYASAATGFYIGNLYGSFKAAQKRNKKFKHQLVKDAKRVYHIYY